MPRASPLSSKLLPLALSLGASMLLHGAVVQVWSSWQTGAGAVALNSAGVRVLMADERPGHPVAETTHVSPMPEKKPEPLVREPKQKEIKSPAPVRPVLVSQTDSHIVERSAPKVVTTVPIQPPVPQPDSSAVETPIAAPALQEPVYVMGSPQNPEPDYPFVARKFEWEGVVRIGVDVSASGQPQQVEVLHSSGHSVLDQTALETIRDQWLFQPARQNGIAVPAKVVVPVQFVLRD